MSRGHNSTMSAMCLSKLRYRCRQRAVGTAGARRIFRWRLLSYPNKVSIRIYYTYIYIWCICVYIYITFVASIALKKIQRLTTIILESNCSISLKVANNMASEGSNRKLGHPFLQWTRLLKLRTSGFIHVIYVGAKHSWHSYYIDAGDFPSVVGIYGLQLDWSSAANERT